MIKSWTSTSVIYYYQDKFTTANPSFGGLGSTTHIANAGGALLESFHYDLYGKPTETSAYGVVDLYAGERWVNELGLYDLRNRFMSPELGRFLQTDPIGFKGDASNLYRYCHNDPEDFSDPMGLIANDAWGRLMMWQGSGDGSISEQMIRLDAARGINSPPTDGHVRIERTDVINRDVDRTRHDSQGADVVDDEHYGDRKGGGAGKPEVTTTHTFVSENATVRPVIISQYGRTFTNPRTGAEKKFSPAWLAKARDGALDHQIEIRGKINQRSLQGVADRAFASGGVIGLRNAMRKATSAAALDSSLRHDNSMTGNHTLRIQTRSFPYSRPREYDE